MTSRRRPRTRTHRWLRRGVATVATVGLLVLVGPWALARVLSLGRVHDVDHTPAHDVAIVYGAAVDPDGTPSEYLAARLDVAADLVRAGKAKVVLVSGDNRRANYNEPQAMKRYLVNRRGVSASRVVMDYAGFDTYDTCVRARRVFGVTSAVLVTQDYHLPRAVATCRMVGVDAVGTPDSGRARDSTWRYGWSREFGARIKMISDVVTRRTPVLGGRDPGVAEALADR